jgi:deoxyinosine 3'endonuclease (endonuclease V)
MIEEEGADFGHVFAAQGRTYGADSQKLQRTKNRQRKAARSSEAKQRTAAAKNKTVSFRTTEKTKDLIAALGHKIGVKTASEVIETAIHELARANGVIRDAGDTK